METITMDKTTIAEVQQKNQVGFNRLFKSVGKITLGKSVKPSIITYFTESKIAPHTILAER